MIRYAFFFVLICSLGACSEPNNNTPAEKPEATEIDNTPKVPTDTQAPTEADNSEAPEASFTSNPIDHLKGYYVGDFIAEEYDTDKNYVYNNKINISIDSIAGDSLFGHSVVAGNDRPFRGLIKKAGINYYAEVREPGDDRYDGTFSFDLLPHLKKVEGRWKAYNSKLPVSERRYKLEKKDFAYDPNLELPEGIGWAELYQKNQEMLPGDEGEFTTQDVLKYNPSKIELKKEDVENMYLGDLEVMRNSIYARHGYSFKNRKMRFIFDEFVDWYIPVSTDIRHLLTDVEKKNIDLIKRYEQHAERYYDTYGR